jgi:hypothetical protein
MGVLGMDFVLEPPSVSLEPRPRGNAAILDPQSDLPLRLAALVLAKAPRDVANMPWRAPPKQPSLLDGQLLHDCDDFRSETHAGRP